MYCTTRQNRYIIMVASGAVHLSHLDVRLQILSKTLLRTVHRGYINIESTVCSVNISKSSNVQLIRYPCASVHFSTTCVSWLTELSCRKDLHCSCAETHSRIPAAYRRFNSNEHFYFNYNYLFTTSTASSNCSLAYFPSLPNHLCRTNLCGSDEKATAKVCSAKGCHTCPAMCAIKHELHWKDLLRTTHQHSASLCYSGPCPQERCHPPSP